MKKFALVLAVLSFAAQAEVITTGGFGTDGASGESMPLETSVMDAAEVYKALDLEPNDMGKKVIELADGSNFECEKPYSGISRLNAGCMVLLRENAKAKLTRGNGLSATLVFGGDLAKEIFAALPEGTVRMGAATKEVANVTCVKTTGRGFPVKCTIRDLNALQMDVEL